MTLLVNDSLSVRNTTPERLARRIEGQFFQILMKEMRNTVPQDSLFSSGLSGSISQELFDQAIAEQVAGSSDLGLTPVMLKQLGQTTSCPRGSSVSQIPNCLQTVSGQITSGYGPRRDPITGQTSFHHGVDIAAPVGQPISSICSGTVQFAGPLGGYGNAVKVMRPDGTEVLYAHCSRLLVSAGQQVSEGAKLAEVGQSGKATGPHLHLEVRNSRGSLPTRAWNSLQLGDPIQVSARSADLTSDIDNGTITKRSGR
jgi:murein DD-endopeptidase MepM/ murein hydrolase activator NlpD